MNLLHYQATFPAGDTRTLTVTYWQFAYADTHEPPSYQLAYVVHPASMWEEFGPINLEVAVPEGVPFRASVPCENVRTQNRMVVATPSSAKAPGRPPEVTHTIYEATLHDKTGELFLAVGTEAWKNMLSTAAGESSRPQHGGR